MQVLQRCGRFIPLLGVITMTAACQPAEPDWQQLVFDHVSGQGQSAYVSLNEISGCRARGEGDRRQLRCQMTVTMTQDIEEIEALRGTAEQSITVAELTHRFGRFQQGDQRQLPVSVAVVRQDGGWQVVE